MTSPPPPMPLAESMTMPVNGRLFDFYTQREEEIFLAGLISAADYLDRWATEAVEPLLSHHLRAYAAKLRRVGAAAVKVQHD